MFGHNILQHFEEDPFFSMHTLHREQMRGMDEMMRDPFHSVFHHHRNPMLALTDDPSQQRDLQLRQNRVGLGPGLGGGQMGVMSPFGNMFGDMFSSMNHMMGNMHSQMQQIQTGGGNMGNGGQSFSQSSFMSVRNDGRSQPQVYQASSSVRTAPGGVKETRKSERDSAAGIQRMAVGHHIGERSHVIQREKNRDGNIDENQDFVNIDEAEAEQFDREFKEKIQSYGRPAGIRGHRRGDRPRHSAITDGNTRYGDQTTHHRYHNSRHGNSHTHGHHGNSRSDRGYRDREGH